MRLLLTHQLRLLAQMRKELVQLGLDALAHAAEQDRDQSWQGQLALARECSGTIAVDRRLTELSRLQMRCKVYKKAVK